MIYILAWFSLSLIVLMIDAVVDPASKLTIEDCFWLFVIFLLGPIALILAIYCLAEKLWSMIDWQKIVWERKK